jgi:hypothetical protein
MESQSQHDRECGNYKARFFQVKCPSLLTDRNQTHIMYSAWAEIVKYKEPGNILQ